VYQNSQSEAYHPLKNFLRSPYEVHGISRPDPRQSKTSTASTNAQTEIQLNKADLTKKKKKPTSHH
jgi:hypothetical protein